MRRYLSIFALLCCFLSVSGQDMKTIFVAMPDSLTPLLTKVNKEDCIDFLASNMKAEVKNRFDKSAEMKALTEDYLQFQMTENSLLEMKLLPLNDSVKVVCMVKTVCSSACDSEIHFYTSDWKEELSSADYLQKPLQDAFFIQADTTSEEYVLARKSADVNLVKAMLSKDDSSLAFIYTTPDYMNKETREKLEPYLRKEPVVLRWQEGKFR